MEIIYADSLFLTDLAADYLLCLISARISGLYLKRKRYFLAALAGALYSVAVFLPGLGFLSGGLFKLLAAGAICLIAFGSEARPLRCSAVFLAVSAAFGGAVWGISMASGLNYRSVLLPVPLKVTVLSFALCYALLRLISRCRGRAEERRLIQVQAEHFGRAAAFTALRDTGNSLTEPVSGRRVMVCCPHALIPLLGEDSPFIKGGDAVRVLESAENVPELRGRLCLVPCSAVGFSGLIPALRAEKLSLDGKTREDILLAVSPQLHGDDFEAVI